MIKITFEAEDQDRLYWQMKTLVDTFYRSAAYIVEKVESGEMGVAENDDLCAAKTPSGE